MPKKENSENFIGTKFNKLTVIEDLGNIGSLRERKVIALCECGISKNFSLKSLKSGHTKSCGCHGGNFKHGLEKHPLYNVWKNMIDRCYNKLNKKYHNYGGSGVSVCQEWLKCENFYNWAINNGYKKGLQLDKDKLAPTQTGKMYCPEYCSFLTIKENLLHKSNSRMIEYNGDKKSLTEWCLIFGLSFRPIWKRLSDGWSVEKAFSVPVKHFKKLAS